MEGKRFLQSIQLRQLLSYQNTSVELLPLNILVGINGSGKSNLIEAFEILRAAPRDLSLPFRKSGGASEWVWKGDVNDDAFQVGVAANDLINQQDANGLFYSLTISEIGAGAGLYIENEGLFDNNGYYFQREDGTSVLYEVQPEHGSKGRVAHDVSHVYSNTASILSQVKDPRGYFALTLWGHALQRIRIYRDWNLGRNTPPRQPQPADMPNDFLEEDASNLGLVLNGLLNRPDTKREIIRRLQEFNPAYEDVATLVNGGTVQIFLHEKGMTKPIPATRVSDGTLRYLCLLSILCHPEPPPLICLEEPEVGLHPDIMPKVAELLLEASQRTQLIVTTHSDALVSALSHVPETILVCERDDEGTHLKRLEADKLKDWLKDYSLGDLWRMGEIGGTL